MVVDLKDIVPFFEWLPSAFLVWLIVVAFVSALVIAVGWLVGSLRHGPFAATRNGFWIVRSAVVDLVFLSPRRTLALVRLAIKESIRRRVVVVFAIFILVLLFAGWFLDPGSTEPARLYLGSVLTITSYLVLLLSLLLSSLSLPGDLKNRTLHTVVTKPVRASEIILGRILGFVVVGTLLLIVMGSISYVFVRRGLDHTHQLTADDLKPVEGASGETLVWQGHTSRENQHRHKVIVNAQGQGHVEIERGHWHSIEVNKGDDATTYVLGPPEDMLLARVPIYGKIGFLDQSGKPVDKGISVGDEWTYRSYIAGGSLAAFVWTFDNVTETAFPKGLPVELSLGVFRTWKANIEKGVLGTLSVRKPGTDMKPVEVRNFESKEFTIDVQWIPREFEGSDGQRHDLFKDFVNDGQIEIWLRCADMGQYFGAAQADMYLRARDASFALNFVKGYVGIWLQMLVVISLGVMFSTFLSGPVAVLATLGTLLGGFFSDYMYRLATGQTYGGGPFESFIRILTQENQTSEMDPGIRTTLAKSLDTVAETILLGMSKILPDFGRFNFSDYVASGFDISGDLVLTYTCRAFAFVLPVFVAGYLCLKNREIGK